MSRPVQLILKPGREASVLRFHPWVFSGSVDRVDGRPEEGEVVEILSSSSKFLGLGHFFNGSITAKIFSFKEAVINDDFWKNMLKEAFRRREQAGLTLKGVSTAYRLVFTEGDSLPGLILDYYNGVAVAQAHTLPMFRLLPVFAEGLKEIYGKKLIAVYNKSSETLSRSSSGMSQPRTRDGFLSGTSGPVEITETGHKFIVDFIQGQKTGFFLDQRGNRMFAQFYAKGRKVLNACCYSGAFSVYTLKGGATEVHSVDTSAQALEWTEQNLQLNGLSSPAHRVIQADIKRYLAETEERYDMIILDPPAFAKNRQVTNNALHAYIHINAEAIRKLNPGGLLLTFSCSQPVSREMFRSAVQSAAIEAGRPVRIMHQLSQGPDHPVSIFHPEGEYLKGLILSVES